MATPTVYTPKRLIIPQLLDTSYQRYYASPATPGLGTQVKVITVTLATSGQTTITVNLVESGASPTTSNIIINAVNIPNTGEPYSFEFDGLYMNAGDEIYAKASSANRISIHISGVELS